MKEQLLCNIQVITRGVRGAKGSYTAVLLFSKHGTLLQQNAYPGHLSEEQAVSAYLRGVDSMFPDLPF